MQFYSIIRTLTYFLGRVGVSTPPTFSDSASACHSHIVCIMIVHTYKQSGLLRHWGGGGGSGGGGGVSLKTFPVSISCLITKSGFFHQNQVCLIKKNPKIN